MSEIYKKEVIIALGHFDSVHIGHQAVIKTAVENANSAGVIPAVFTFDGDLKSKLSKSNSRPVYTIDERISLIKDLGIDEFYVAPAIDEFLSISRTEFLDKLNEKYTIIGYVSGTDYRFGKNASGDVGYLNEYALEKNQTLYTVPDKTVDGEKVSTTLIKKYLTDGKILDANRLLGRNYSVSGKVIEGRKVGRDLGFPTVNINVNSSVLSLKDGVYQGETEILGKRYKTVINYGARPTFNLTERLIEAHVIGFSGDLYGETLKLEFTDFLREVMAFRTKEELSARLKADVKKVIEND